MSGKSNMRIGKEIAGGSIRAIAFHITVTYVLPLGAPVVTGYLGYIQGLPWMYIMVGALAAFALAAHGVLKFDKWRERRRVEGKLSFNSVRVANSIKKDGIVIGLHLRSSASFPIEFEIAKFTTKLGDKVPIKGDYETTSFVVPANGIGWFYDHPIMLTEKPKAGTIDGQIEYEVNYGRSGLLKYNFSGKKRIVVAFSENGSLANATWNDIR